MVVYGPELTDEVPVDDANRAELGAPPYRFSTDRYVSPEWADRERERLWPRLWQLACTADHVPEPGDVHVYDCGDLSVLLVRGDDGEVRAFQNTCRHRGATLCDNAATGLTELRCGYHRWCWDLRGRLREVPSRKAFGPLRNDDLPLLPVKVGTWGPFVFVNLDTDAEPLDAFLEAVPDDLAWAGLDAYTCRYGVTVPLPCNWKVGIEAFGETYHVQGIHREMLPMCDDVHSPNHIFGRHGRLIQPYGLPSPRLRDGASPQQVWEAYVTVMGVRVGRDQSVHPGPHPPIPGGATLRDVLEQMARAEATRRGLDFSHLDQHRVMDMAQYNLFPNVTMVVFPEFVQVVRTRPGATPDDCFLDGFYLERIPDGAPRARTLDMTLAPSDADFGLVLNQDLDNLQRVQRGLHQPGMTQVTLSQEEIRIVNIHRHLERMLDE